jgi:hypothetical protein
LERRDPDELLYEDFERTVLRDPVIVAVVQLDTEDERKSFIDGLQLTYVEAPSRTSQTIRINDGRLLDEYARLRTVESDRWTKACWSRAGRGRRNEHSAQRQKLVGLNDHRIARASLLSASQHARSRQVEYLAADHLSS